MFTDKEEFISSCREIVALLSDCTTLDKKIEEAYTRLVDLTTAMQEFIKENAMKPQDEDFYKKKMAVYNAQKAEIEKVLQDLQSQKAARLSRKELLDGLIRSMEESDEIVTGFDENLWRLMVENVTVGTDGKLTFTLRNGTEI